ncbi:hypothetical protein BDAP_001236 [Binucleata daphniae]
MQSKNIAICDDLGWTSNKISQKYVKEIGIELKTEAYDQSLVLLNAFISLSFGKRIGLEQDNLRMNTIEISEN